MTTFHRILVAIDGSAPSDAAATLSIRLAKEGTPSALVFCHVIDVAEDYGEAASAEMLGGAAELVQLDKAGGAKLVDAAVQRAHAVGIDASGIVLEGNPAPTIAHYAVDHGMDLIVTGTHGHRGLTHLLLGSTAEGVLREATVPVLTVRQATVPDGQPQPIAHAAVE